MKTAAHVFVGFTDYCDFCHRGMEWHPQPKSAETNALKPTIHELRANATQPAPDTGEWRLFEHYRNARGERTRILDFAGIVVAETQTEAEALQIIADHTAVRNIRRILNEPDALRKIREMLQC